jgi:hypothetical protein
MTTRNPSPIKPTFRYSTERGDTQMIVGLLSLGIMGLLFLFLYQRTIGARA